MAIVIEGEIIEKYETWALIVFGLSAYGISCCINDIRHLIDSVFWIALIPSLSLSFIIFVIVGLYCKINFGAFPRRLKYYQTFFYTLIGFPLLAFSIISESNIYFDKSSVEKRELKVIDKFQYHRSKKGRHTDSFYLTVDSWIPNTDNIRILVDSSTYLSASEGDIVILSTRNGFWNLPYYENNIILKKTGPLYSKELRESLIEKIVNDNNKDNYDQ